MRELFQVLYSCRRSMGGMSTKNITKSSMQYKEGVRQVDRLIEIITAAAVEEASMKTKKSLAVTRYFSSAK